MGWLDDLRTIDKVTKDGHKAFQELEKNSRKAAYERAQALDCYYNAILAMPDPDWWPDGSLKFNVFTGNEEYLPIPRGMYRVNCVGEDVKYEKHPELPRPPHPLNERSTYIAWLQEIRPLSIKQIEEDKKRKAREAQRKAEKESERIQLLAALKNPNLENETRNKIRHEISQLVHDKAQRKEPVVKIREATVSAKYNKVARAGIKDSILGGCTLGFIGYIVTLFFTLQYAETLTAALLIPLIGACVPIIALYLIVVMNGGDTSLTTRGANEENIRRSRVEDFYFNPPEDIRLCGGVSNLNFYNDGSLKYIKCGTQQYKIPKGLYFLDENSKNAEGQIKNGPHPPNPNYEQEKFQIWMQEIRRVLS